MAYNEGSRKMNFRINPQDQDPYDPMDAGGWWYLCFITSVLVFWIGVGFLLFYGD